jgi:hypothetical protein
MAKRRKMLLQLNRAHHTREIGRLGLFTENLRKK